MSASSLNHALLSIAGDRLLTAATIDINEPEAPFNNYGSSRFLCSAFNNETPALIFVSRCYRNEWIGSIALWPTADAEQHMPISAAGSLAGEVFAWGWLNRWQYDRRAIGIERFHDARTYVASGRKADLAAILASHAVAG